MNLGVIHTLAQELGLFTGYSDHTEDIDLPMLAAGALVIEKHNSVDVSIEGPDLKASLEQCEFRELVWRIRLVEMLLGHGRKEPKDSVQEINKVASIGVVAEVDIPAGVVIAEEILSSSGQARLGPLGVWPDCGQGGVAGHCGGWLADGGRFWLRGGVIIF